MNEYLIHRLLNRTCFIEAYWEAYRERNAERDTTYEEAYDYLENICRERFGVNCFPSYDAFRKYCKRHR